MFNFIFYIIYFIYLVYVLFTQYPWINFLEKQIIPLQSSL